MDALAAGLDATPDGDLMLCLSDGMAFQAGSDRIPYDASYFAKVAAYEDTEIALAVNRARCAFVMRNTPHGSVLDVGAGTGAFVRDARSWGFDAYGYDVMPEANERLRAAGLHADPIKGYSYDAVTMWDVLEHMESPGSFVGGLARLVRVFVSIPIFDDLRRIRASKHYRPGEHLHYWTHDGFVAWAAALNLRLLEESDHEIAAGRESIGAFAFLKE